MTKLRKTQARLDRRRKAFDDVKAEGSGSRKDSKYIRTESGKAIMYHRPGAMK